MSIESPRMVHTGTEVQKFDTGKFEFYFIKISLFSKIFEILLLCSEFVIRVFSKNGIENILLIKNLQMSLVLIKIIFFYILIHKSLIFNI